MIPKFRAWYKRGTLPMLTVSLISFDQKFVDAYIDEDAKGETEMSLDFDDIVLMQSTGLVDKNGQEIFEGDVVLVVSDEFEADTAIVKSDNFGFYLEYLDMNIFPERLNELKLEIKVLGNIHENNDLVETIKGKKK